MPPRRYIFDVTSLGQRSSPWLYKSVKVKMKLYRKHKLRFSCAQFGLRQMYPTSFSVSIEAKFRVARPRFDVQRTRKRAIKTALNSSLCVITAEENRYFRSFQCGEYQNTYSRPCGQVQLVLGSTCRPCYPTLQTRWTGRPCNSALRPWFPSGCRTCDTRRPACSRARWSSCWVPGVSPCRTSLPSPRAHTRSGLRRGGGARHCARSTRVGFLVTPTEGTWKGAVQNVCKMNGRTEGRLNG